MTTLLKTSCDLYLTYNYKPIIAGMISEKIKEIVFNYGENLNITIKKRKHISYDDLEDRFPPLTNGFYRYTLEDPSKKRLHIGDYLHTREELEEYLNKVWFDYEITWEELK